jgi:hypothetical protein
MRRGGGYEIRFATSFFGFARGIRSSSQGQRRLPAPRRFPEHDFLLPHFLQPLASTSRRRREQRSAVGLEHLNSTVATQF